MARWLSGSLPVPWRAGAAPARAAAADLPPCSAQRHRARHRRGKLLCRVATPETDQSGDAPDEDEQEQLVEDDEENKSILANLSCVAALSSAVQLSREQQEQRQGRHWASRPPAPTPRRALRATRPPAPSFARRPRRRYVDELNLEFGIPNMIMFTEGDNGLPRVWLKHLDRCAQALLRPAPQHTDRPRPSPLILAAQAATSSS